MFSTLLDNIELLGVLVTADALHCQKTTRSTLSSKAALTGKDNRFWHKFRDGVNFRVGRVFVGGRISRGRTFVV